MDEIKKLLLQCGLSDEAAIKICESLADHANKTKQQLDEQYQQRLTKAKQVCVQECEAYEVELARRLQMFLEAKGNAIEQHITKQSADRGVVAESRLQKIAQVMSGVESNGASADELRAENQKLKQLTGRLMEQRDKAVSKANRVVEISERVLARNKKLETIIETRQPTTTKTAPGRLDAGRKPAATRTTRRQIAENIDRTPAGRLNKPDRTIDPTSPVAIAESMD